MDTQNHASSRRGFLKGLAIATAGASMAPSVLLAQGQSRGVYAEYGKTLIGSMSALRKTGELDFSYPDANSPCKAVLVGREVSAYSTLCTHKGCPTMYDAKDQVFNCPCHYSRFDAAKDGQQVIGQATARLPRVRLEIDGDKLYAVGVDGLIFGRSANIL